MSLPNFWSELNVNTSHAELLVIYKPPSMPEEENKEAEDGVGENDVISGPRKNLNLQM